MDGNVVIAFLSTLSLRRATICTATLPVSVWISIHALLAESDGLCVLCPPPVGNFYPRSPCGERLALRHVHRVKTHISIHALLAESDPERQPLLDPISAFLSTLSLRRATIFAGSLFLFFDISIHALLAESDTITRRSAANR